MKKKKSSKKLILAMLSVLLVSSLVSSLTVTPCRAADYTKVGVNVGDWAYYSGMTNMTGLPPNFEGNFTVTNIDRSNATGTLALYYTDGTFIGSQTIWGNISSGVSGPTGAAGLFWFLLVPNLAKGDMIFVNNPALWINDTGIMVAGGRARPYTHINVTVSGNSTDLRMDQATGIGMQVNLFTWNGANHFYLGLNLTSTSLWSPADYTRVGVKVGDWVFFSLKSNQTNPPLETATSGNLTIVAIDRLNITFRTSVYNASGPMLVQTNWGNVSDGTWGPPGQPPTYWWLIVADLVKYDLLYHGSSLWINETVTTTIFGASRECNHLHTNVVYLPSPVPGSMDLYWDKATGMTVKGDIIVNVGVVWRIQWNVTSTSLWSPAPTIDQPTDITYTFGTTGHSITWHPSSNVPYNYAITRNGTVVSSGSWNGQAITCNVDGLEVGTYVYNCTVFDTIGRRVSSIVTVRVSAAPQPFPVELLIAGIAGIAAVVIVAAVVVLRRRSR